MFVTYESKIASFNPITGALNWNYTASGKITILSTTDDNGVVTKVQTGGGDVVTRDSDRRALSPRHRGRPSISTTSPRSGGWRRLADPSR